MRGSGVPGRYEQQTASFQHVVARLSHISALLALLLYVAFISFGIQSVVWKNWAAHHAEQWRAVIQHVGGVALLRDGERLLVCAVGCAFIVVCAASSAIWTSTRNPTRFYKHASIKFQASVPLGSTPGVMDHAIAKGGAALHRQRSVL